MNIAKYITPSFNLRGNFRVGMIDGTSDTYGGFENRLFDINVLLDYKFNNGYILKVCMSYQKINLQRETYCILLIINFLSIWVNTCTIK